MVNLDLTNNNFICFCLYIVRNFLNLNSQQVAQILASRVHIFDPCAIHGSRLRIRVEDKTDRIRIEIGATQAHLHLHPCYSVSYILALYMKTNPTKFGDSIFVSLSWSPKTSSYDSCPSSSSYSCLSPHNSLPISSSPAEESLKRRMMEPAHPPCPTPRYLRHRLAVATAISTPSMEFLIDLCLRVQILSTTNQTLYTMA